MKDIELFSRIKNGDKEAFFEWFDRYGEQIARFALQYGLSKEASNELAMHTFRALFTELDRFENEGQLFLRMYQIAMEKLKNADLSEENEFAFEEDFQFHEKVRQLNHFDKLTFILTYLQQLDTDQIDVLVPQRGGAQQPAEILDGLQIVHAEKRLKFLRLSHERIAFTVDQEALFESLEANAIELDEPRQKISKRGIYTVLAGVVTLAGLVIFSIMNSESYKQASFEKMIEQMEETYEEKITNTYKELGIEEADYNIHDSSGRFSKNYLGNVERFNFERFIKGVESKFEKEKTINEREISKEFDEVLERLEAPSEMATHILNNPITDNLEASEQFLEQYVSKQLIMNQMYMQMIYDMPELAEAVFGESPISLDELKRHEKIYTKKVELLITGMEKQNVLIKSLENDSMLIPSYGEGEFSRELTASLHPDVSGYIKMLESSPLGFYYVSQINEIDEHLIYLQEIENTLLNTSSDLSIHEMLTSHYIWSFIASIKLNDDKLYSKNGTIQKDVRQVWEEISESVSNPALTYIIEKVITEFKDTDWKYSKTQLYLSESQAFELTERPSRLSVIELDWDNYLHELYSEVTLPNTGYEYLVQETYEKFKENYDLEILRNSHPLTVAGMYLHAEQQEDAELIWHLHSEESRKEPLEKFKTVWKQSDFDISSSNTLLFDASADIVTLIGHHGNASQVYEDLQLSRENGWTIESFRK